MVSKRTNSSEDEDIEITEQSESAKEDTYQDVLDVPPTFFGFVNKPEIIIDRKERQQVTKVKKKSYPTVAAEKI
ncbi:hypothetical protein P4H70_18760 [Paenibacillus ehimensis]|uniref:hypothetical protein n=1 Tax=Paenibacillus ehimensis TaxID=79264 RepID=UPI002DB91BC8|nr:hypothetical protein [Paenibacillus ehimensis]MEC0210985.1 hypothetical protein [Paenibacillus ehimensis]